MLVQILKIGGSFFAGLDGGFAGARRRFSEMISEDARSKRRIFRDGAFFRVFRMIEEGQWNLSCASCGSRCGS
jgi:hypothetical protein